MINWLVGQGHPSEKSWSSSIGMIKKNPNILMGKCQIDGNQTTNQTTINLAVHRTSRNPSTNYSPAETLLSNHGWMKSLRLTCVKSVVSLEPSYCIPNPLVSDHIPYFQNCGTVVDSIFGQTDLNLQSLLSSHSWKQNLWSLELSILWSHPTSLMWHVLRLWGSNPKHAKLLESRPVLFGISRACMYLHVYLCVYIYIYLYT